MKFKSLFATGLLLSAAMSASAQNWVVDSLSTETDYLNNVYYSLKDGVTKQVNAKGWHLAFTTARMSATILTNSADESVKLFAIATDTSLFGTNLTAALPTAIAADPFSQYNSNLTWDVGAFNQKSTSLVDFGWGVYDQGTHLLSGSKIFALITATDTFQILIQSQNGLPATPNAPVYKFKYAQLDGSSVVEKTIELGVAAYANQNFAYFNLETETLFAREPETANWDFLFTNYNDHTVQFANAWYKVFGLLTNKTIKVAKESVNTFQDNDALVYNNLTLSYADSINAFGYNRWKTTSNGGRAYDTLSWFVQTAEENIYQVVFTKFVSGLDPADPGKVVLQKRLVYEKPVDTGNSIDRVNTALNTLVLAPNPAIGGQTNIIIDAKTSVNNVELTISDVNGRLVYRSTIDVKQGFYQYPLSTANLNKGMFIVNVRGEGIAKAQKLIVQ